MTEKTYYSVLAYENHYEKFLKHKLELSQLFDTKFKCPRHVYAKQLKQSTTPCIGSNRN